MFMGEYGHSLDPKGRLIIPSKFRESLGERFVITRSLDQCLCIYRSSGSLCASFYPVPMKWSLTSKAVFLFRATSEKPRGS